jgi:hypothetical protein
MAFGKLQHLPAGEWLFDFFLEMRLSLPGFGPGDISAAASGLAALAEGPLKYRVQVGIRAGCAGGGRGEGDGVGRGGAPGRCVALRALLRGSAEWLAEWLRLVGCCPAASCTSRPLRSSSACLAPPPPCMLPCAAGDPPLPPAPPCRPSGWRR